MSENRFADCKTPEAVMWGWRARYLAPGTASSAIADALARIRELTPLTAQWCNCGRAKLLRCLECGPKPVVSEEARERARAEARKWWDEPCGHDPSSYNHPDALADRIIDALGYTPVDPPSPNSDTEPPCNPHPDAPHGFDRNSSLNEDRYVCECEGWAPPPASPSAANGMLIGPRCCYCGGSVANPGDECGMCVGSKAAQQRRGEVDTDAELTTFREPAYFDAEPDPVPASPPVVELDAAAICRVIDRAKDIIGDTDQLVFHRDDQRLTLYRNDFGLVLRIGGEQ